MDELYFDDIQETGSVEAFDVFLAGKINALAEIKAKIADLQKQEAALKDDIISTGAKAGDSDKYHLTVTTACRETLDMEAVREKLSPQFIAAHTKKTDYVTIRVTARKTT